jgi:metal-responsive CopG/Arc/MetJ family transcriptional regulator
MAKVKTAISIDGSLLEETAHIAEELDIPRSQVVSLALEEYIQRYRNKQLLDQINEAYADAPDKDEAGTMEIIRSHRKKLGDREEWK